MAEYLGTNAYLIFGSTVLSGRYTSIDKSTSVALVDKAAGSDIHESFLAALKSGAYSVNFHKAAGDTATQNAVAVGIEDTLIYAPEGTASGKPKHSAVAIVESLADALTFNGLAALSVSFKNQEAVTLSVY